MSNVNWRESKKRKSFISVPSIFTLSFRRRHRRTTISRIFNCVFHFLLTRPFGIFIHFYNGYRMSAIKLFISLSTGWHCYWCHWILRACILSYGRFHLFQFRCGNRIELNQTIQFVKHLLRFCVLCIWETAKFYAIRTKNFFSIVQSRDCVPQIFGMVTLKHSLFPNGANAEYEHNSLFFVNLFCFTRGSRLKPRPKNEFQNEDTKPNRKWIHRTISLEKTKRKLWKWNLELHEIFYQQWTKERIAKRKCSKVFAGAGAGAIKKLGYANTKVFFFFIFHFYNAYIGITKRQKWNIEILFLFSGFVEFV